MKKVLIAVIIVMMFGVVNAGWESGCGKVEVKEDINIQMEDWYNTFPKEKECEVEVYDPCDTDASYLADPKK